MNMLSIKASVGFGGVNKQDDVALIQLLLKAFFSEIIRVKGRSTQVRSPHMVVDGECSYDLITKIRDFQSKAENLNNPIGRIEPNSKSFKLLASGSSLTGANRFENNTGWSRYPWEVLPGFETIPMAIDYASKMRSLFRKEYERLTAEYRDKDSLKEIQLWKDWSESYSWWKAIFHSYAWREEENFERYRKKYMDEVKEMRKLSEEARNRMYQNLKKWY